MAREAELQEEGAPTPVPPFGPSGTGRRRRTPGGSRDTGTGANENHNGIIRRFLPKGAGFAKVGRPRIGEARRPMAVCPRGLLGGETPAEAFGREFEADAGIIKKLEVARP